VTPSCHIEREGAPAYCAFFSSSLSGTAPLLPTECLTMMSAGVASFAVVGLVEAIPDVDV